jgi:hypothetical protein
MQVISGKFIIFHHFKYTENHEDVKLAIDSKPLGIRTLLKTFGKGHTIFFTNENLS